MRVCLYYIRYPLINIIKWCLHFFIWPILEARTEFKKEFLFVFGGNENNKICFWNLLTFSLFILNPWVFERFVFIPSNMKHCAQMQIQLWFSQPVFFPSFDTIETSKTNKECPFFDMAFSRFMRFGSSLKCPQGNL